MVIYCILMCATCGGENVLGTQWFNLNSGEADPDAESPTTQVWCNDCGCEVGLTDREVEIPDPKDDARLYDGLEDEEE